MSILNDLLGNDEGNSGSSNSSDFLGVLDLTGDLGLDIATESSSTDTDDSDSSSNSVSIDGLLDVGGVLGSSSDSQSDDDGGSLLGLI